MSKSNTLKHVGILGMRWGRRKGTTTTNNNSSPDHKTAASLKRKKLSNMSNDELKKVTARLQLERQFKDLSKMDMSPGKKFLSEVLQGAGKQLASKYVANAGEAAIKALFEIIKNRG